MSVKDIFSVAVGSAVSGDEVVTVDKNVDEKKLGVNSMFKNLVDKFKKHESNIFSKLLNKEDNLHFDPDVFGKSSSKVLADKRSSKEIDKDNYEGACRAYVADKYIGVLSDQYGYSEDEVRKYLSTAVSLGNNGVKPIATYGNVDYKVVRDYSEYMQGYDEYVNSLDSGNAFVQLVDDNDIKLLDSTFSEIHNDAKKAVDNYITKREFVDGLKNIVSENVYNDIMTKCYNDNEAIAKYVGTVYRDSDEYALSHEIGKGLERTPTLPYRERDAREFRGKEFGDIDKLVNHSEELEFK